MTTQQIEYILALSDEKSFSKAAQKLYVSQPALSQFVKNLESELNVLLFDRSTCPIKLTYAGELYVYAARKIQAILTELNNQFTDLSNVDIGQLTIGTTPFRASCLLPKSIAAFRQKHPGVHIHIIENKESVLESFLLGSRLDICIMSGPVDNNMLHSETLAQERLFLAVPPDSPINKGKEVYQVTAEDIQTDTRHLYQVSPIDLSFFVKEIFVLLHQDQSIPSIVFELSQMSEFNSEATLYTDRIETAFSWTLSGIACSFIPDTLIRFGNYERHPIYYKINNSFANHDIVVAFKKNRYFSRAASEYILLLKQLIGYGTWLPPTEP
jgi:DNA-binding transcriptional LysR family regulator